MTINQRALVALAGRWRPGMLFAGDGEVFRLSGAAPEELWWLSPTGDGWVYCVDGWQSDGHPEPVPDLSDPATLGAYLDVVREALKDPEAFATGQGGGWAVGSLVWASNGLEFDLYGAGATEGEALVAALEAAPRP